MEDIIYKDALFTKSFYMLGDSLKYCYNCKYCRLGDEKEEDIHYNIIPSKLNKNFVNLPVSVNLFYGDPLLQIDNTIKYLKLLEKAHHKGPVIIITKGDYVMLNINKVIILEIGEEYLVLDKVNYQDTDYYYIAKVNESETDIENDYKLVVVTEKDNNKVITEVTGEEKLKEILPLFESTI